MKTQNAIILKKPLGSYGKKSMLKGKVQIQPFIGPIDLNESLIQFVKKYRKSTNAKDMIYFGKRCSDELRIPLVIGVVSNERTKPKMELYRRQLGEPCGGYFIYSQKGIQVTA